jgi:hypothetical protein
MQLSTQQAQLILRGFQLCGALPGAAVRLPLVQQRCELLRALFVCVDCAWQERDKGKGKHGAST